MAISKQVLEALIRVKGDKAARAKLAGFTQEIKHMSKNQSKTFTAMRRTDNGMQKMSITARTNAKGMKTLSSSVQDSTSNMKRFKMEWLSVMFFSMQMTRVFKRMLTGSIKTFMKIAGETDRLNQSMAAFGAQMTFVKFTMGRALAEAFEPFLPMFIHWVEVITDWISQHPEKTAWALVGAFVAFFALFTAAQIALVTSGLAQIAANIASAGLAATGLAGLEFIAIGLSIVFTYLGWKMIGEGLDEDDWKKILLGVLGFTAAGALIGFKLGGVAGIAMGATIGVSIGMAITIFRHKTKVEGKSNKEAALETFVPSIDATSEKTAASLINPFQVNSGEAESQWQRTAFALNTTWEWLSGKVQELNEHMFSDTKQSYPMMWALNETSMKWTSMADVAVINLQRIIATVNAIPREVVTIHRIVEIRSSKRQDEDESDGIRRWI